MGNLWGRTTEGSRVRAPFAPSLGAAGGSSGEHRIAQPRRLGRCRVATRRGQSGPRTDRSLGAAVAQALQRAYELLVVVPAPHRGPKDGLAHLPEARGQHRARGLVELKDLRVPRQPEELEYAA